MRSQGIHPYDPSNESTLVIWSADLVRVSEQIGTIEVGKAADIIAVPENPLKDISVMLNVNFVMARGEVVKD